jgi:hypothetical protein
MIRSAIIDDTGRLTGLWRSGGLVLVEEEAGISCNVIAGLAHDHLFVGWDHGPRALALLGAL